jgi:hypothetical protein
MPLLNQSAFGIEMNQRRILICNRYYSQGYSLKKLPGRLKKKASFNRIFKQLTRQTPTEYCEKLLKQ